eukprot:6195725-Pleurochrysis_carterae.AAC.7
MCLACCAVLSEFWASGSEIDISKQLLANCPKLKQCLVAPGTRHTSFSDAPCWYPGLLSRRFGIRGKEEPLHSLHEAMAAVCANLIKGGNVPPSDTTSNSQTAKADSKLTLVDYCLS